MTDDATLSTPPAPDAVKRYFVRSRIERIHDCDYVMPCSIDMVDASDYDSLARQRDALKARVEALMKHMYAIHRCAPTTTNAVWLHRRTRIATAEPVPL